MNVETVTPEIISGLPQNEPLLWERRVAPGDIPRAQVECLSTHGYYERKAILTILLGVSLWLTVCFIVFTNESRVQRVGQFVASKLGSLLGSGTDAPNLTPLDIRLPQLPAEKIQALTSVEDAITWISESEAALAKGQAPKYCVTTKKITDDWLVADGTQPNCRISKSNVWVWALLQNESQVVPMAGVFHRGAKNDWTFHVITDAGVNWPRYPAISLQSVARAVAEDLPELNSKEGAK